MSISSTRRALVVGGTSGIGGGIAQALAKRQYEVMIGGRSREKAENVLAELSASDGRQHKFVAMDGFDLQNVKEVAAKTGDIDVLVFTQGIATLQGYTPTKDGIDQKLQLHYFSRVYLSLLLCPHMKPGGRVLTVLSGGVHSKYKGYDTDFDLQKTYSIKNAADAAGYYTDAGFESLATKFPSLTFAHASPGLVATNWGTEMPALLRVGVIRPLQSLLGRSSEQCGEILAKAFLDDLPAGGGFHLIDHNGRNIDPAKGIQHTPEERDVIWEKTLALLPDIVS